MAGSISTALRQGNSVPEKHRNSGDTASDLIGLEIERKTSRADSDIFNVSLLKTKLLGMKWKKSTMNLGNTPTTRRYTSQHTDSAKALRKTFAKK